MCWYCCTTASFGGEPQDGEGGSNHDDDGDGDTNGAGSGAGKGEAPDKVSRCWWIKAGARKGMDEEMPERMKPLTYSTALTIPSTIATRPYHKWELVTTVRCPYFLYP